ncbi:hypothetical protein AJ80_04508 [Polytolypa hystricis UAMH7299]|uniref:Elongation factor 2 n=1 Tax=Polytolypa hystricis (strain UAMH7299) TaxID=1447883 RepID=A0A2B7YAW6_POLH7|nr:hypothetical protein AJ80_04508 [Polytolypa hystricis UAMH7299]
MEGGSLTAQPLATVPQFNWVFLVELIVCGILILFFLFYFNRLFAALVSYGIRAYTWHFYRVWVDINALQISLLGGRIFFKGLRYHGENETIVVQTGYITWRYWLRSVRTVDLLRDGIVHRTGTSLNREAEGLETDESSRSQRTNLDEGGGIKEASRAPCRIEVTLHGLEWFVYNRSAAYDTIVSGFGYSAPEQAPNDDDGSNGQPGRQASVTTNNTSIGRSNADAEETTAKKSAPLANATRCNSSQQTSSSGSGAEAADSSGNNSPVSKLLGILPVRLICHKGAMVVGNENARCIMTIKFDKGAGHVDAGSAGQFDIYRQIFEFDFLHPVVQMKPNPDFKGSQWAAANSLAPSKDTRRGQSPKKGFHWKYRYHRRKMWHSIRELIPYFQRSVESFHVDPQNDQRPKPSTSPPRVTLDLPGEARWLGLRRYLDEEDRDEHEGWNAVEYARFSTLVDCPSLSFKYYWDIPGKTPSDLADQGIPTEKISKDINGAEPPEWGLHLGIRGGAINYGPWADRERIGLQTILFPNSYRNSDLTAPLRPNQSRQNTVFKLTVDIEQETTLRIPTRESSKDWLWKGRAEAVRGASKPKKRKVEKNSRDKDAEKGSHGPDIRPFGWLSLRVEGDSTISYTMDMVASTPRYNNRLDIDLRGSRMTSSVNHGLLWQSGRQTISCDLSNPLEWNALHTWSFNIESRDLDLFLLRDHMFLMTDLVNDWGSSSLPEFYTHVAFKYNINFVFANLRLFLNVNDSNIINNPSDTSDNAFFVIKGSSLSSHIGIPMVKHKPNRNCISFDVNLSNASMELMTPIWNTQHTFLQDQFIASLKSMNVNGNYCYNIATAATLTDALTLNVTGASPKLHLYGFLIRYALILKDNYFGEHLHFKTLEEYQALLAAADAGKENPTPPHVAKSNDLDVILHVHADNPTLLLPANIYDARNSVKLNGAVFEADLRFTNYYMDLETILSPLEASLQFVETDGSISASNSQLFVDGVAVYGHRLFGLPPTEPTYVCNWDFDVGNILGECSPEFLKSLISSLRYFGFSIDDEENALPPIHPVALHDVTFLRATVKSVKIWALVEKAALLLDLGALDFDFNDWAGSKFSERMNLRIPNVVIAAVDRKKAARQRDPLHHPVKSYAYLQTAVTFKMVERKADFFHQRSLQQQHIRVHDERSHRTPWLLRDQDQDELPSAHPPGARVNPPPLALPSMPRPSVGIFSLFSDNSSSLLSYPSTFDSMQSFSSSETGYKDHFAGFTAESTHAASVSGSLGTSSLAPGGNVFRQLDLHAGGWKPSRASYEETDMDEHHISMKKLSSPWTTPHFHFQNVQPDTRDVPSLERMSVPHKRDEEDGDGDIKLIMSSEYNNATHTSFLCDLTSGITGFCSPESLDAISSLLDGLQPAHPVDIIDDLQASVVSDILGQEKTKLNPNRTTTFSVRSPASHFRIISSLIDIHRDSLGNFRDQYDLTLSHARGTFRTKVEKKDAEDSARNISELAVHFTADSISLTAQGEKVDAVGKKGSVHCKLDDVLFWLVSDSIWRSHLQIQDIDAVTSSKSVEDLAFFVQRTNKLTDSIAVPFQRVSAKQTRRLHALIYCLTRHGAETPDPLFLTRPSYVLRSAGEHLRLNDSWKITSRFRNIFKLLSSDQATNVVTSSLSNTLPCPSDARSTVLSSFDRWRTWDLAHVKKSYVMKYIWGKLDAERRKDFASQAKDFALLIRAVKFSLDPGPKESNVLIEDLSTILNVTTRRNTASTAHKWTQSIVAQTYCSNAAIGLKWEVCELIEGMLNNMNGVIPRSSASSQVSQDISSPKKNNEFHFVFMVDQGRTDFHGINLKVSLVGDGIKGSIVRQPSIGSCSSSTCVVLGSDASSVEFLGRSGILMTWKLLHPNAFISHCSQTRDARLEHEWKCAAACQRLRYDMKEDPLGIIQVVDRLIEDEVKYILELMTSLQVAPSQDTRPPTTQHSVHLFHLATFLDDYEISFTLLPSLIYVISGQVARLSVAPTAGSKWEVDFDAKDNLHTFRSGSKAGKGIISVFNIPPTNGRVLIDSTAKRTVLDIDSTIEHIKFDAGAVRNLLGTVNGPEIKHLVSDAKHDAELLKHHLDRVLSRRQSSPLTKPAESRPELVYKVRLTSAGIGIHSTAPGLRSKDYSADMSLSFGMIQLHAENSAGDGPILEFPEFHAYLSRVGFALKKSDTTEAESYGDVVLDAQVFGTSKVNDQGDVVRSYHLASKGLEVNLYAETASMIVDIAAHLQERLKTLDLSHEIKHLRKRLIASPEIHRTPKVPIIETQDQPDPKNLFHAMYSIEFNEIQVSWIISSPTSAPSYQGREPEDLVFSIRKIELTTQKENAARLRIQAMQLQMVPMLEDKKLRSKNSALMPEVVFNVAYASSNSGPRLAFQAAGKALDIRMTSEFIVPASILQDSIASASEKLREANSLWSANTSSEQTTDAASTSMRLRSLLVDADFAGAVLSLQGRQEGDPSSLPVSSTKGNRTAGGGKYGQYIQEDPTATATLRAPGVALKIQFDDTGVAEPTLNAEIKVAASTNVLYPAVVPLVTQISASIKEVVGDSDEGEQLQVKEQAQQMLAQGKIVGADDPQTILGRCKLNIGLWICRQEFTLSCQPIARVAATACFKDSYIAVNTVQSAEQRRFFAILVAFNSLEASVKHVYSSESTASFAVDSVVMSMMNSKHISTSSGISAILKISPTKVIVNAKQVQDFLLFREIWALPNDPSSKPAAATPPATAESQAYIVQRYQQMASAGAFPWNSVISIAGLDIQLDLGQTLGKTGFKLSNLWLSSKKSSDWEQNLCIGFDNIGVESKGRLSGHVELRKFKVRTSIKWPDEDEQMIHRTPLVQASIAFDQLQAKVAFEYQPFLVADVTSFDFLMYNVRAKSSSQQDRLVSILHGDKFQVFCTSLSASQGLALYQTLERLAQDKQTAYEASLKEIEKFLRRKSTFLLEEMSPRPDADSDNDEDDSLKMPISLHTDVVVYLAAVNIGAFHSTFHDNQVFKLEALDAEARFSVSPEAGRIHSGLGLTLGQLRVALSSVNRPQAHVSEDLPIEAVVQRATGSRGGTILKVPRVVASMETWQSPESNLIEYIFKSSFEGKVDVGWNYSRISFIRGMWSNHSRALATRLGKPLPQTSALQITSERKGEDGEEGAGQEKFTAVVNVPQSKYTYAAMEPPVIETPQLRDMGEATPPLEWIGLHRDKLPNLTHQIIIVTLMEIAKDVEDAYSKILGS